MKEKSILFVCTGNTCRSPMAEYLAKKRISEKKSNITVASAGITAFDGDFPSSNAIKVMHEIGIDISSHRAAHLTESIIVEADCIFTMTRRQADLIKSFFPFAADKIRLLGEQDITDPYGGNAEIYRSTRNEIDAAIENMLNEISGESDS